MLELGLAVAPGLAIMWYVYHKDEYDKEPKKYLIVSFLLGMLSVVPAFIVENAGKYLYGDITPNASVLHYVFYAFIVVGGTEELCKFSMLRFYAYKKTAFDEPFDGIVYSVMVAMGFATLENIGYVEQHGIGTALLRMFLSVPAHAAFGVIIGYYTGLAKFNPRRSKVLMIKGLLMAILFHGSFDCFLFLQDSNIVKPYVGNGLLFLGAVVSYYFAMRFSLRAIRMHQEVSRTQYQNNKMY
jgi:protease PrsW